MSRGLTSSIHYLFLTLGTACTHPPPLTAGLALVGLSATTKLVAIDDAYVSHSQKRGQLLNLNIISP